MASDAGKPDSFVIIQEPRTQKYVQFGRGRALIMDMPFIGLTADEAERAAQFFGKLGVEYPLEYEAPETNTGRIQHSATYRYNFGHDASAATQAAVTFFETVYLLPADFTVAIDEN